MAPPPWLKPWVHSNGSLTARAVFARQVIIGILTGIIVGYCVMETAEMVRSASLQLFGGTHARSPQRLPSS